MAKAKQKAPKAMPGNPDPKALSAEQLAELLTQAGRRKIAVAAVKADIAAGAPTNGDGTVNLLQYAAWLAGQL